MAIAVNITMRYIMKSNNLICYSHSYIREDAHNIITSISLEIYGMKVFAGISFCRFSQLSILK